MAFRHLSGAEERFKADGRSRLVWSTLAAAAVHAVVFFGTPSWISPVRSFQPQPRQTPIEWIVVTLPPAGLAEVIGPQWEGDGSSGEIEAAAELEGSVGSQSEAGEMAGASDALREVLLGRELIPSLAEPEPGQSTLEQASGSGSMNLEGGGATTVDLEGLAAADSLALELLTALRPELVVLNPSTWILIRNPTVVENFMRQRASNLPDLDGGRRSTSVALWIDESGSVEWAEISESSGRTDLDELALQLFSEVASFRPARDHGVRVPTTAIFTVHFPW
jgi:TonB family protein